MVITIHKFQGISIKPGHPFENVIIYLPEKRERTNPGSELVAFSHVTNVSVLIIYDTNRQITIEVLKNIGNGNNYNNRKKLIRC